MEEKINNEVEEEKINDVAVIGLGPSGIAACVELVKRGYNPIAYNPGLIGGQINNTAEINNYPSFSGPAYELVGKLSTTVKDLNITVKRRIVQSLTVDENNIFTITTPKDSLKFKVVIIATGTRFRPYAIPDTSIAPNGTHNRGFSRCAICDGPLYKGKDVMVIGGGDAAFEEGLYLSDICKSVTLINRRSIFRAPIRNVEKFKNRPNTKIITPAVTVSCSGTDHLEHVVIADPNDMCKTQTLDVEGCFIYIGSDPVTDFVNIENVKNDNGTINVNEDMKVETVKGLFACGDVINTSLRQVSTAVGYGSKAGIMASKFLNNGGW